MSQLEQALNANNRNAGGWFMPNGQEQLVVRGYGLLPAGQAGLDAIGRIPVSEYQAHRSLSPIWPKWILAVKSGLAPSP